jgi:hypothetical protein
MKPMMLATIAVLFASVIGQIMGASEGSLATSIFAAAAFTGAILQLAWRINKPWWRASGAGISPAHGEAQPLVASRNANLLALGYGWGGLSLLGVYLLSPLRWQHGWQYGSGMVVIAGLIWLGGRQLSHTTWSTALTRQLVWLSLAHGWAAAAALGWLIVSGKFITFKGDWAANIVFFCGALIIGAVSAMGLRTARILDLPAGTGPT